MLVNKQLPSLNNGVSQQPATMRLLTQAELSINHYPTVVDGLRRRPPALIRWPASGPRPTHRANRRRWPS